MNPLIGQALIGGVGRLIGTGLQSRQQNRNVRRTIDANKALADLRYKRDMEMAEYSFDKNLEMWKMQNQYNSPEAQMQRFEDAGLNKHMIYGQGTPGNATGSPSFTGPSYQPPTVDYSGQQSTMGNTLSDFIGASKDVIGLRQEKEKLDKMVVDTWLAENTAQDQATITENMATRSFWENTSALMRSKIDTIHADMWNDRVSPNDSALIRGLQKYLNDYDEVAPQWLKTTVDRTIQALEDAGGRLRSIFDSIDEFTKMITNPSSMFEKFMQWNYPGDSKRPIERIQENFNQ